MRYGRRSELAPGTNNGVREAAISTLRAVLEKPPEMPEDELRLLEEGARAIIAHLESRQTEV